jgi:DNA-binding MarR family transcriptional regulator
MAHRPDEPNTLTLITRAHLSLSRRVTEGVARAGHPLKPSHSAVFGQISPQGSRLTAMARTANMTPQAMSELVDELELLGYVERGPDPTDRRAKLIRLTELGEDCMEAGTDMIDKIERHLADILGDHGRRQLRELLSILLEQEDD